MELSVVYSGGKQFEAIARDHRIICDQPLDDNGTDRGMTPPELFLAGLGSCAAYYAAEYLNVRDLPSAGLEVKVSALKSGTPVRITDIQISVLAPGLENLHDRHRDGVKRAVQSCLLHNTLAVPATITISIGAPVAQTVEEPQLV